MKLKEIADLAKVSITTVSRVLNNKEGVSAKNRKAIEKLLIENGFYKREEKFSQKIGVGKIALVLPDLKNPFFGEMAKEISDNLREIGYQTLIFNTNEDFALESDVIKTIIKSDDITGVIICISSNESSLENIGKLKEYGLPVVLIDRELDFHQDGVFMDDFKAGFLAAEALIMEGHREIGIITTPIELTNIKNRFQGYLHALKKYDIPFQKDYVFYSSLLLEKDLSAFKKVFDKSTKISCVITVNNTMTMAFLKILNQKHYVDSTISLIGIGNFDYFDILQNNVSYVDWDIKGMSEAAVTLLLKKTENMDSYTRKIILEPHLILKGSEKYIFS